MSAGGRISMSKQFGVDFYSEVVVVSLFTKDAQIVHGGVNRGTNMIWCLEEDQSEFLGERRQWDLAEKHSQFIGFSINSYVEKSKEKKENEEGTDGDVSKIEKFTRRRKRKRRTKRRQRRWTTSGDNSKRTGLPDAQVGGCDERRVRIILLPCIRKIFL